MRGRSRSNAWDRPADRARGKTTQVRGETATTAHARRARLRAVAAARGVPLPAILVTVVVVVLTTGIVTTAAFIAYQLVENHVLNPWS